MSLSCAVAFVCPPTIPKSKSGSSLPISDQGSVLAGVASLIEQLVQQSSVLGAKQVAQLCKIEVIRRGGWNAARPKRRKISIAKLGNRTWIVGVRELKQNPKTEEQKLIDRAERSLEERNDDDFTWIKWDFAGASRASAEPATC
jgi:hypothetical protein